MANRRLISIDLDGDTLPERVVGALDGLFISPVDLDAELAFKADKATTVTSVNGVLPTSGNVTLPWAPPVGGIIESDLSSAVQTKLNAVAKPVGGWLKTDLATAVQTSLSKADTAVQSAGLTGYAPLASPALTGTPTAPTATTLTSTTQLATTAFVQNVLSQADLKGDKGDPGLVWKGAYSSSAQYATNDAVTFAGSSYRAIVPSLSQAPTNVSFWELLAAKGEPGDASSGIVSWSSITGAPATFPPSAHTHTVSEVTDLQAALDAKIALSGGALSDGANFILGTATGTKFGTAITQKMAFYNATPIIQPLATTDLGTVLSSLGLRAAGTAWPITTSGVVSFSGTLTTVRRTKTVTAITANITLTTSSTEMQTVSAATAPVTINLPATTVAGIHYTIKRIDNSANPVTITALVTPLIDDATTVVLTRQFESITLMSTTVSGTWRVVNRIQTANSLLGTTATGQSLMTAADAAAARGALGTIAESDPRLSDARTPTAHNHDGEYYTKIAADGRYVSATGSSTKLGDLNMDGGSVAYVRPDTAGGWARGFWWNNRDMSRIGGIGVLGTGDSVTNYYIGFGSSPWVGSILQAFSGRIVINGGLDVSGSVTGIDAGDVGARPAGNVPWTEVSGKPTEFTPVSHTHDWASITSKPTTFAPTAHTHPVADLTATGTRDATTYLRGDGTWSVPPTGGQPGAHTHLAADISDSTATGRSVLTAASAAAARTAIGAGTGSSDLVIGTAATTAKAGNYQPSWADVTSKPTAFAPIIGSGAADAVAGNDARLTNSRTPTAHTHLWADLTDKPTTFAPTIGSTDTTAVAGNDARLTDARTPTDHTHPAIGISDSTATGRSVITATDAAAARTAIGAGTSSLALGTTGTTAKAGDYAPTWAEITSKPTTFAPTAHTHLWADLTDKPATFAPTIGSTATTAVAGNDARLTNARTPTAHTHLWADLSDKPSTFAPTAHTHLWADLTDKPSTFAPTIGSTATTAVAGNDARLSDARTPTAHTHPATAISDSSAVGRSVLTAADAAAARTAIGAGTGSSNLAIGTTSTTAKAGDYQPTWTQVTSKPTTFAPIIGTGAADAVAGNDARLTNARTPTAHTHATSEITGLDTALEGKVTALRAGAGLWYGTQTEYDALPAGTKNALGFVGVIWP